jgi:hypothetical protein
MAGYRPQALSLMHIDAALRIKDAVVNGVRGFF